MKTSSCTSILALGMCGLLLATLLAPTVVAATEEADESYDLLILAPVRYKRILRPLVAHKNAMDVPTKLITLPTVYAQMATQGRDRAEQIKYFIKTAHEQWNITYVMLVGNFRQLPIRYCHNADPWEGFPEPYFISELYYADLYDAAGNFSSWDSNGNGIYGEWKGDEAQDKDIDLYPDVYVGRLACRNVIEAWIMTNKIITYETTTYDSEWFSRAVAIAGDTYPPGSYSFPTPDFEGEENVLLGLSYLDDFEHVTLFTSDGTLTGPQDVVAELSKGCGFVYFDGHANPASWSTHPPNDKKNWTSGLALFDMIKLRNRNKYPVCIVGGCHNLQFDTALTNFLKNPKDTWYYSTGVPECWGWRLTRKIGGGSIATIGCSGLGMTKEDKESQEGASDYLDPQFFWEYGVNGTDILGETWGKAITNYLKKYPINWSTPAGSDAAIDAKTVQQWILLGDPSLKIGGYPL